MSWRCGEWTVAHTLPIGASTCVEVGATVRAGDVIATGTTLGAPVRLAGARRIGVPADDLARVLRVAPGAELERGTIIARTGRRFARAVSAPFAGRLVHVRSDGDLEFAPVIGRWSVRSSMDGAVARSNEREITVVGASWCLQGLAAYGADAQGEIAVIADGPAAEVAPSRIDVAQRDRILIGGGRTGAESIARAHACGVSAVVTGAVPGSGLRSVFGDRIDAHGAALRGDVPTVLCLAGFGSSSLPPDVYSPFVTLAGTRAALHAASARLFVFAAPDAVAVPASSPSLALTPDWGAVRATLGRVSLAPDTRFASEVVAAAVALEDRPLPSANVLAFDAPR